MRRIERLGLELVWRLPRRLIYWAIIRAWAHATAGPYAGDPPLGLRVDALLDRWLVQYENQPSDPAGAEYLTGPPEIRNRWGEIRYRLELLNRLQAPEAWMTEEELFDLANELDMDALILVKRLRASLEEGLKLEDVISEARIMRRTV